ncbi:uncharacterized protein EV422DRAFT_571613 [Fimicolochytrium jonesii]|uniref:uncharacterized protein n=1 Tax=Fimicolochytrium jonesii TaxID=1396493 RepID=UPI0022FF4561|nr:uncharacterized protein EV422DRAFT_571613 [Fimicolochytrium jonesii]KAI8816644.1 hypothetical protein EV422DRAFT_571613 [Fimicolochytrium jonesii]
MRLATPRSLLSYLALAFVALSPFLLGAATAQKDVEPQVDPRTGLAFTHAFPNNPFKTIITGESTPIALNITNGGEWNHTLVGLGGFLAHPRNLSIPFRNLTTRKYKTPVRVQQTIPVTYNFIVETEAGEYGLVVFANTIDNEGVAHRVLAYQGLVTIADNDSLFDLQSLSIYALLLALIGGIGYSFYNSFLGAPATSGKKRGSTTTPAPIIRRESNVKPGEPDMDWIPDHHLKQEGKSKRQSARLVKKRATASRESLAGSTESLARSDSN